VTTSSFGSDPVFDFILGSAGARLKFPAALGLTFMGGLLLAATVASEVIAGDVAVGAFVVLVAVLSWWAAPVAAVVAALMGFLFANGFALDTKGTLSWHGESDLLLLAALIGIAVTVSVMGNGRRLERDEVRQSEWWGVGRRLHR
jgi:K+-sensing histidine kinase KdpD